MPVGRRVVPKQHQAPVQSPGVMNLFQTQTLVWQLIIIMLTCQRKILRSMYPQQVAIFTLLRELLLYKMNMIFFFSTTNADNASGLSQFVNKHVYQQPGYHSPDSVQFKIVQCVRCESLGIIIIQCVDICYTKRKQTINVYSYGPILITLCHV